VTSDFGDCDIAIAGAGVAGLAAALGFANKGFRVHIIDRRPMMEVLERGDVLHEAGWRALKLLGMEEIDPARVRKVNLFEIWDSRRRRLVSVDLSAMRPACALRTIPYSDLRKALHQACCASTRVTFSWGVGALDLAYDGSRVCGIVTRDGRLSAALSIVATGSAGIQQVRAFGTLVKKDYKTIFVSMHAKMRPAWLEAGIYALTSRGVVIGVPLAHDRVRLGVQVGSGKRTILDLPSFSRQIERMLPGVSEQVYDLSELQHYSLRGHLVARLAIPGAVVCGDAAHTIHPAGGQGMNLALLNVAELVQAIPPNLSARPEVDQACQMWHARAHARSRRIYRRTHILGRLSGIRSPTSLWFLRGALSVSNSSTRLKEWLFAKFAYLS
jgi:2-polyprenyl-6-methoxyphenol hydroxylase-like FAD-dependent oxidoreductase